MSDLQSVFILGRQPAIGRAELESVLGVEHCAPLGDLAMATDLVVGQPLFERLGSSVKAGEVLGVLSGVKMASLHQQLNPFVLDCARDIDEGKIQLGLSAYGVKTSPQQLVAIGLNLKKTLRAHDYSVRLIPNQAPEVELSSAQVLHNHLTGERGIELLLIRHGADIIVARTTRIQDIDAYARRDQGRPKRDAFVGMLPPKLAQTIVNLATAQLSVKHQTTILDPFCGTGVLLQEALLMGFSAYGTDIEPRMIDFSSANIKWLRTQYPNASGELSLEMGDATNHRWKPGIDTVACEAYLGHPLASWPRPDKLQQIIGTCNLIIEKFLRNLAGQISSGTRCCIAVPAWVNPNGSINHLPALDHLEKMGYNRVSFMHVRDTELVYHRSNQIVARELLVITRK